MLNYFAKINEMMKIPHSSLESALNLIHETINLGSTIWIMGNGGSASTAEHFETDLSYIRAIEELPKIKAFALTSNSSVLTAIGNDIGFENIFCHQLERKGVSGDLAILISASGNSENLLKAARYSNEIGIKTLAIVGFDGGELLKISDQAIFTRSTLGFYGPVEDIHLSICHYLAAETKVKIVEDINL